MRKTEKNKNQERGKKEERGEKEDRKKTGPIAKGCVRQVISDGGPDGPTDKATYRVACTLF